MTAVSDDLVFRHRLPLLVLVFAVSSSCKRKHVPVDQVPELGYPACNHAAQSADERVAVVASGHLRSGPLSKEQSVVEHFQLERTTCGFTLHSRQEWPLAISDIEVRYDEELKPLWAWKRMTVAGSTRADGNADVRRYELRTGEVFIKRRDPRGELTFEKLLPGGRMRVDQAAMVGAVVGPGRGVITAWLRRAKLPVGGKVHELVLDFREMVETLEMAKLERQPDLFEPTLNRTVRAYTFFGRETVFADENDVVIGDLAGMRPSDTLSTPEPEPLPMYGGPDPVHTP
ncbi:MAG TPA: hypothetical protein VNZ26_05720 [Vicinamibacterales bacterium]|nr:hypothetical protein [Vicinamibacterales bacterium]